MTIEWSEGVPVQVGELFSLGLYEPSPETKEYWEGLRRKELLIKQCSACRAYCHPRRMVCPTCMSNALGWVAVGGRGKVYSYSVIYRPVSSKLKGPYAVGLIELGEGIVIFGRIKPADDQVLKVGADVKLSFNAEDNMPEFLLA